MVLETFGEVLKPAAGKAMYVKTNDLDEPEKIAQTPPTPSQ